MMRLLLILLVLILTLLNSINSETSDISEKSPYYQHLEKCDEKTQIKTKKKYTNVKGIVCPMVKDEIGFLSEWVAYYEMQGFNHVIFYDNNSTTSFAELDPWIKDGFVTIRRDWYSYKEMGLIKKKYDRMMAIKFAAEIECKERAVKMGYEIFVSVDLDEYLMPSSPDVLVIDELVEWFNKTTRGMVLLPKLQFPATPHILEPVNLLTIEAYQSRMRAPNKMNYYNSVSPKVALRLQGAPEYTNRTWEFLVYCCDFHGCGRRAKLCHQLYEMGEKWKFEGKHRRWLPSPNIYHYARTMEKYMLKIKTWSTAGANTNYGIYNYLERVSGHFFDNTAVKWGCRLRDVLRQRTKEKHYLRPGDFWYRNPEFGKLVTDERKRGRYGAGLGKKV